jgi:adenine-specific DNA methylase
MYEIHKYWARKPDNVVATYIEHYSRKRELVLDPFSGSGVTAIEALRLGRRAVGVDIDPVANFIAKMTAQPVDLNALEKEFVSLENDVKPRILEYFETRCPECHKKATIHFLTFANNLPAKIAYYCDNDKCKSRGIKKITDFDRQFMKDLDGQQVPYWYPDNELVWNSRVNVHQGMKVSDLFSKRNLIALSILNNRIGKVQDQTLRDMLRFAFSAALPQASKMLVHTEGQGPGWKVRGYWIPPNRYEMNVWRFFENKFRRLMAGKAESNNLLNPN